MNDNFNHTNPNSGQFVLDQLRRFGSHMNRTHEVSFWLYFPSEASAKYAANRAERAGLITDIGQPPEDIFPHKWSCILSLPHIPDETILDGIFEFCDQLASDFHGEFDGWEASIELDEGERPTILGP